MFRSSAARAPEPEAAEDLSLQITKETERPVATGVLPRRAAAPAPVVTPEPSPVPEEAAAGATAAAEDAGRRPRHDEKVTFYCTASDLTRIERARLALRAEHKLASDRGRIVRAALAEILDDFDKNGAQSALVRRLQDGQRA